LDVAEASHLLDLFTSGQHDTPRIVAFLTVHPALAAEALKRANSAMHYRSQPTTEVRPAVLRLGGFELYDIIFKALAKHQRERPYSNLRAESPGKAPASGPKAGRKPALGGSTKRGS